MSIAAGSLDRRLKLYRRTTTTNALNEEAETFTLLATVWAKRTDVKDAEQVAAAQVGAEITARFLVRWSTTTETLTPMDRVTCEGREYEVTGRREIGRREGLEISAVARADKASLYE